MIIAIQTITKMNTEENVNLFDFTNQPALTQVTYFPQRLCVYCFKSFRLRSNNVF